MNNPTPNLYSSANFRRALAAFVGGRAVQAVAGVALTLISVRALPQREYGLYMLLWGAIEVAVPITSLGLLPAVQQFLPRLAGGATRAQRRQFLLSMESARYALIVALAVILGWQWERVADWLHWQGGQTEVGLLFPAVMTTVLVSRFTAEMLESLLAQSGAQLTRAIQPVGRLLALCLLWAADSVQLSYLLWADLGICGASVIVGNLWLRARLRSIPSGAGIEFSMRQIWRFAAEMSLAQVAEAAGNVGAVRLVAGRCLGPDLTGVFAFMQQLVLIGSRYMPAMLLANVVRPMIIARHAKGDTAAAAESFGLLLKVNLYVSLGLLGTVAVGGDELMRLLGSPPADHRGAAMFLLVVGLLATAQQQVAGMAMQVYGYTRMLLLVRLAAPAAIFGAAIGAKLGSLIGLAVGVAAGQILCSAVMLLTLRRQTLRASVDTAGRIRGVAVAVASGAVSLALQHWVGAIQAACLFVLLYSGLMLASRPLSAAEGALVSRAAGPRRGALLRPLVRPEVTSPPSDRVA